MEDRPRQLDVTKVPRTFRHSLAARLTLEVAINSTHPRIHQPSNFRFVSRFIDYLRVFDLCDRVRFLHCAREALVMNEPRAANINTTHDLFRRQNPKLHLLHLAKRGRRVRKLMSEHDGWIEMNEESSPKHGKRDAEKKIKRNNTSLQII